MWINAPKKTKHSDLRIGTVVRHRGSLREVTSELNSELVP